MSERSRLGYLRQEDLPIQESDKISLTFPPQKPSFGEPGVKYPEFWDIGKLRGEILANFLNQDDRTVVLQVFDLVCKDLSGRTQLGSLPQREEPASMFRNQALEWPQIPFRLSFNRYFEKHTREIHSYHVARDFIWLVKLWGISAKDLLYGTIACLTHDDGYKERPFSHAFDYMLQERVGTYIVLEEWDLLEKMRRVGLAIKDNNGNWKATTHEDVLFSKLRDEKSELHRILTHYPSFDFDYLINLLREKEGIGQIVGLSDKAYLNPDSAQVGLIPPDAVRKLANFLYYDPAHPELGIQMNPRYSEKRCRRAIENFLYYRSIMYAYFYQHPTTLALERAQLGSVSSVIVTLLDKGSIRLPKEEGGYKTFDLNSFLRLSDQEIRRYLWRYFIENKNFSAFPLRGLVFPRVLLLPPTNEWGKYVGEYKRKLAEKEEERLELEGQIDWDNMKEAFKAVYELGFKLGLTQIETNFLFYDRIFHSSGNMCVKVDLSETKTSRMRVFDPSKGQFQVIESSFDWRQAHPFFGYTMVIYDPGPHLGFLEEKFVAPYHNQEPRITKEDIFHLYLDWVEGRLSNIFEIEKKVTWMKQFLSGERDKAVPRNSGQIANLEAQRIELERQSRNFWENRGKRGNNQREFMLWVWEDAFRIEYEVPTFS